MDPSQLTYIVGNPPFIGAKIQTEEQRNDLKQFFEKNSGIMDYVSAWYVKAKQFMDKNKKIRTGFVSTNSITQGEQVEPLWKPLFESGIQINFAYNTFKWSNEAKGIAAVHVIIIAFSYQNRNCIIYSHSDGLTGTVVAKNVSHINAYLVDGEDVFLTNRSNPICDVPEIGIGNKPIDDGNYLFTKEERDEFILREPISKNYFRRWYGSREFINNIERYCLWLGECSPTDLKKMPMCLERVDAVRKFRLGSKSESTRKIAATPTRFHVENIPSTTYLIIPETSSERRDYIPIGFMNPESLASNAVKVMANALPYHFAILTSKMHMVWMSYVCGRLKSDYRYSVGIVYNNFPWPNPPDELKTKIEKAAEKVLEARALYPDSSLADLYDPLTMPAELHAAHNKLDALVESAYRKEKFKTNEERISFLFKKYQELIK